MGHPEVGSVNKNYLSPNRRNHRFGFSQFSFSSLTENLSEIFSRSLNIHRSASNSQLSGSSGPSRKSHSRRRERLSLAPFAKTNWPVPLIEALFLPEFKINPPISQSSFNVIKPLSQGAFGQVFKVQNIHDGKFYAMKVLNKCKIVQDSCVNQIKDEVKIQTMCGHNQFIVGSPFHWQSRRQLFIVTEFLEGGDLYSLCERYGSLPEDLIRLYVAELALALDFLHNAGVIYRDLKLENVLLDVEGHAMLTDFGLSKWLKYGDRTQTLCGTLQYIAPEVFTLQGYTHSADWWSLGVLTCYLYTSKYPETGNSQRAGTLPEGCELSVATRDLLGRLLQTDPTKRLRSLYTLQNIHYFLGYNFATVRNKQTRPRDLLLSRYQKEVDHLEMKEDSIVFNDFESMFPTIV